MTVKNEPLAEVSQRAIQILCRELGAVNTVRFINQFTTGHGDYTAERDDLFAEETLDQIIAGIKGARPERQGAGTGNDVEAGPST
ncbi:MAG: hypothetical protein ACYC61_31785 [Isosphaeraceae bacterium]